VSIQIFVTSGGTALSEIDSMDQDQILEKDDEHHDILATPWFNMENGRPDLKAILREEVNGAVGRMSVSGMSFVISSHPSFVVALSSG
jgi:ferric-chelate reductase